MSGVVRNNNDGSSKSWAQVYLYVAERMGGRGVALASDRAGIEQIGPRFGPYAAWALQAESDVALKKHEREVQRGDQAAAFVTYRPALSSSIRDVRAGNVDKGVRYDHPIGSFHSWLYEFGDSVSVLEEDVWKALAFITGQPRIQQLIRHRRTTPHCLQRAPLARSEVGPEHHPTPLERRLPGEIGHEGRIENFVRGWHAASEQALTHPNPFTGDSPWEQAAFFALRHNLSPCDLTTFDAGALAKCWDAEANAADRGPLGNFYWTAKWVYDLWQAKDGDNEPLRRMVTGTRHWDFNLDGLGNYGLLPDFLQDLRNVGINASQMNVLFSRLRPISRCGRKRKLRRREYHPKAS